MIAKKEGLSITSDHKWHKTLLNIIASRFFSHSVLDGLKQLSGFWHVYFFETHASLTQ